MTPAWPEVALGDICQFKYGKSLPAAARSGMGFPVFGSNGEVGRHEDAITSGPTIVVGRKGSFGEVHFSEGACWPIDTTYFIDESATSQDLRWLFYLLDTLGLTELNRAAAIPGLNRADAYRKRFPLPPLDEQRRIAAILDKADEVRTKRKIALETLEMLSQAIFIEMFGDPVANPMGWPTESLSVLTSKIGSGATPRGGDSAYKDHGIPLIRSLNIHDGRFLRRKLAFLDSEQAAKLDNVIVEENDVLLNITGASVARVCTVPNWVVPARVNQHVAIIRCEPVLSHCFLQAHLQSKSYKSLLLTMAESGATRQALTKGQIGSLKIMLPPRNLQASFESAIESATSNFDSTLKFTVRLSQLFASLQQRAFQGLL